MVDLPALKDEITALGNQVKTLKTEGGADKAAMDAAVQALLAAKKNYAEHNNGIGVDGKPYEEPMSKAQKKAKAKAEKGPAASEEASDPNSANAQKRAAKKAAKLAKKQAHKAGGDATGGVAAPTPLAGPPVANKPAKKLPLPAATTTRASRLTPGQVVIHPNAPLQDRPVVALSVAVLLGTINDLELVSDHHVRHTALGIAGNDDDGAPSVVTGDLAMARYLARQTTNSILPATAAGQAHVDAWVDYAQSLTLLDGDVRLRAIAMTLGRALDGRNYLVGHAVTLADLALFAAAGFPTQHTETVVQRLPRHATAAARWLRMMAAHPALQEATQLCVGVAKNNTEADGMTATMMEPLVPGMNALEGAVAGRVVTRFPPEPSGYLHIGHAKAVLLNDYYARRYKGRLILRFDDTNPSKEKQEYQESIVVDLGKLGVKPDLLTYTSDYFDVIMGYGKLLIRKGLAYMDDTPQEQMKVERAERQDSKHRKQTPEEALKYFDLMCSGAPEGAAWCLRARIDMKANNGTMRDPVLFRQNTTPHHRSGTKYKAYPTYDLACPIVDSIEGVTHALRTTEYNDRDEQYQWVLKALDLRRPRNHNFSRVNFENTVLSKRKLTWFVDNGYVTGWDDPRFPTVRGVVRRGIDVAALRSFMYAQGASRNVVNMVWNSFWGGNKKEIDGKAKRFMAIDKERHVRLVVSNGPAESDFAFMETTYHPKDPTMGTRVVRLSKQVLLEAIDVDGIEVGEEIILLRWGVVKITKVDGGLEGEYIPGADFKKPKRRLSWIADVTSNCRVVLHEFDNLVNKAKLEEEDDFQDFINPDTLATTEVIGDAGLKTLVEHELIQLERRGFFRVDRPYIGEDKPLMLFMIPDGKAKSMGGLEGKLAHR